MHGSRSSEVTDSPTARPSPPPRASSGVLIVLGALLLGCFIWIGVIGVQHVSAGGGAAARWAGILFVVCWTALTAVVIAGPAIQWRTELSERSIAQMTLGGRAEIDWGDVTTVQHRYPSILSISDGKRTINVAVWLYRDADALSTWIESRLRESGAPAMDEREAAGRIEPDVEDGV